MSRSPNFDKMYPKERVSFTCTVAPSSGWEYLWYHNRKEVQAANSKTYTIDSVDHSHSGQYHCKAKRGKAPFYTEESETASLQVSGKFDELCHHFSSSLVKLHFKQYDHFIRINIYEPYCNWKFR